jgi:hypothetical protein
MTDKAASPVPFAQAGVGDEAYTWENHHGGWGGWAFETVDPNETGAWPCCVDDATAVLVRKRWRLVEVTEMHTDPVTDDDDLPGMWSHSDILGGDPDERSHAERSTPDNTDGPVSCG